MTWDYVVVGAGSAGCVLAARLSERPATRVLLLEAGGPADDPRIDDPLRWTALLGSPLVEPDLTAPQAAADGRRLFAGHGRVIGGSGTINAMIHHRPTPGDIDGWALDRWRWTDLAPMFARAERWTGAPAPGRGTDGPIVVGAIADPPALVDATFAAAERLGHGVSADINGAVPTGAALNQLAYDGTHRQHAGRAYLAPAAARETLRIETGAAVTALLFDGDRCTGVRYVRDGETHEACAAHIILSAGALRTPQLLMLAGIGPADQLRAHGIAVRADAPGIGANLHDHILVAGHGFATPEPVAGSRMHGSVAVLYAASGLDGGGPDGGARDVMLNVTTNPFVMPPLEAAPHGFKTSFSFTRPRSCGTVRLAGSDPAQAPLIDHRAFADPHDMAGALAALELSRALFAAPDFAAFAGRELDRALLATPAGRRQLIVHGATCFGHHSGTCRMGDDAAAPVDQALRVRGVRGLSVADASVIPAIPSCPTNALVVAMAELFASRLADQREM